MLMLRACWSRKFWENGVSNEVDWTREESTSHFEEKQRTWKDFHKSDADVEKPSHVRVRVLECIVRVLNPFL